jgi:thymidylate synthase (FAD)
MTSVKTVWTTPDAERLIAYMARVSNPANQANEKYVPLIKYLIKHKHWSPFEMVNVCMEIECTRDIARQVLRHRSFSFQEFSQRYAVADGYEYSEARLQDEKNRQNSLPVTDRELSQFWEECQQEVLITAKRVYETALSVGIAKEVARKVLPEGMTTSRMYMNGTLRSWLHYVQIRTGVETQKEHREVADLCEKELWKHFPNVMEAMVELR